MSGAPRRALVRGLAAGLYHARLTPLLARSVGYAARKPSFVVFAYHRVNDDRDPFFPSLPTEVFERQMAYVARMHRVLTLEELVDRMRGGAVPSNALAITFDDGYRDTLTHAAPILARYGLPATIFLATGFIGTDEAPWFDRLALAFKSTKASSFQTPWGGTLSLAALPDRLRALQKASAYFKGLPDEQLGSTLEELQAALGVSDRACVKSRMLTWDDVHALLGLGFSLGAHTVHHPILSRVTPERALNEIEGSRAMIESACGRAPQAFAYPNGRREDYSETVKHLVREAGFTCAVTSRLGSNTRDTSPWELRRGGPSDHHFPTWALKLAWYRMIL